MTAPLPRRVIVDDADPRIQYSSIGQWTSLIGGPPLPEFADPLDGRPLSGPPFQNTTHFTNTASSLSLQFRGSQPQVFGAGGHYECFIDNTNIGSEPTPGIGPANNILLCDGAQLSETGEYTLTLNVTQGGGPGGIGFYFDYITYIPSASDTLGSATVLIDNLDPAVVYVGGELEWSPSPLPNQLGQQGPLNSPPLVNLGVFALSNRSSLIFNFTGTSVSWVGFIPVQVTSRQSTSNAIYSIDNAEPVSFTFRTSIDNLTNQVLFTSPTLDPGLHSLKVTTQGNNTLPVVFNRSQVIHQGAPPPLVLNHFVVTNNVSLPTPPAATSTNKPSTSVLIGAIVGGAIGGMAVLCLAAFLLRRRIRHQRFGANHDNTATPHLMPFDATSSGRTVGKAGDRTLKAHRSPMVDPPELNAVPQAETFNQREPPLRTPPVEAVREDRSAGSVTDGVADPPPSYVSQ